MFYIFSISLILLLFLPILKKWRTGVFLMFLLLITEDLIRRLIPGQPANVMLIKDAVLFLTYISFLALLMFKRKKIWQPPFVFPLFIFIAISIVNIFNYNSPNLLFGLVGLRSYLWYIPLIFLGYHMFDDEEKLLKFCRFLVYLAIPLVIFAAIQYAFYSDNISFLKPFESSWSFHNFGDLEIPLLSSFFGTGQRYGRFSLFIYFLGLGLLSFPAPVRKKILVSVATFCAVLGIFFSGSRTAFAFAVIGSGIYLFVKYFNERIFEFLKNHKRFIVVGCIFLAVSSGILYILMEEKSTFIVSGFYYGVIERIPWVFEEFSRAFSEAKIFGNGTGTLSQGLDYISGGTEWLRYQSRDLRQGFLFETGVGKILFELGLVGLFSFYLFFGCLFYNMFMAIRLFNNQFFKDLGWVIIIYLASIITWFSFFHNQVLGDATTLIIVWFFIGIFFKFRSFDYDKVKLKAL